MKNLNKNLFEAYQEAVKSIENEGKTSRLCRFYKVENENLSSALINVRLKKEFTSAELNEAFTSSEIEEKSNLEKLIKKETKSTFFFEVKEETTYESKTLSNGIEAVTINLGSKDIEKLSTMESTPKGQIEAVSADGSEVVILKDMNEATMHVGLSPKSTKGIYKAIKTGELYKGYYWTK